MKALFVLLLSVASFAQTVKPKDHKIFNLNHIELSIAGGLIATDGVTSNKLATYTYPSSNGRVFVFSEVNPIARPFVNSTGGTVSYFTGSFAALVGTNYLLRNHTTTRHIVNWSVIGVETYWSIHNFRLIKQQSNSCVNTWITQGILVSPCHR